MAEGCRNIIDGAEFPLWIFANDVIWVGSLGQYTHTNTHKNRTTGQPIHASLFAIHRHRSTEYNFLDLFAWIKPYECGLLKAAVFVCVPLRGKHTSNCGGGQFCAIYETLRIEFDDCGEDCLMYAFRPLQFDESLKIVIHSVQHNVMAAMRLRWQANQLIKTKRQIKEKWQTNIYACVSLLHFGQRILGPTYECTDTAWWTRTNIDTNARVNNFACKHDSIAFFFVFLFVFVGFLSLLMSKHSNIFIQANRWPPRIW